MSDSRSCDNKPSSQLSESLSALVDDEVTELELHRILAESEQDLEVRTRWHRYQVASAAIRQDYQLDQLVDISGSVKAAIATIELDNVEPDTFELGSIGPGNIELNNTSGVSAENISANAQGSNSVATNIASKGWRAAAGRFAIAASVAGLVLVGGQQMNLVAFNEAPSVSQFAGITTPDEPESLVSYSSAANNGPATLATEEAVNLPFVLPADTTPVPMQTVSDGNSFAYQERRQPQLRYQVQDPRLAQYDQLMTEYFNQLILEHAESAASNGSSSLLPYARVPEDTSAK